MGATIWGGSGVAQTDDGGSIRDSNQDAGDTSESDQEAGDTGNSEHSYDDATFQTEYGTAMPGGCLSN